MKKNLLFTTALVAATMGLVNIANAEGGITVNDFVASTPHNGAYYIAGGNGVLQKDITVNGQATLDYATTLTGDKNLIVNGYLTQTQSGSDISGVNVQINKGTVAENVEAGALVLGNDLTVGHVLIGEGTDIALYVSDDDVQGIGQYAKNADKTLNIANGKVLAFTGNNKIRPSGDTTANQTLTVNAEYGVVYFDANGKTITLDSDLTVNGQATLDSATTLTGSGNLTVNGYLTETADGSDISGVNVQINEGKIEGTKAGALVLGNRLTVGNIAMGKNTDIVLYSTDEDYSEVHPKTLTVTDTLTFEGSNEIRKSVQSTADSSLVVSGNVVNKGQLTGDITLKGGSYGFDVKEDATSDAYVKGTITLDGKVKLDVDVSNVTSAKDKLTFADKVKTQNDGDWIHNLTNNIFTVSISEGKNALEFAAKSAGEIAADTGASGSQAAGVNAIISGGTDTANDGFNKVAGEVQSLMQSSDKADVAKALEMVDKMSSDLSNAVTSSAVANNAQVLAAVGSRFTGGSVATSQQGMASGDSWLEKGAAWVQGLFNKSKLDTANGFEANSEGIAFGFEKLVHGGDTKVGVGYAYTQSDIDADSRDVDGDTHTLMV